VGGDVIVEEDGFAGDVLGEGVEHDGEHGGVALDFDGHRFGRGEEFGEEVEGAGAVVGEDEVFVDGGFVLPGAGDGDGGVGGGFVVEGEEVFEGPAGAGVDGVLGDLAVHFVAVELPEGKKGREVGLCYLYCHGWWKARRFGGGRGHPALGPLPGPPPEYRERG
jgi:hypothetical protein